MTMIQRLRASPPASLQVAIVGQPTLTGVADEAERLERVLRDRGHRVTRRLAPPGDRDPGGTPRPEAEEDLGAGVSPPEFAAATDLVIVLGGDGTILRTARWMGYGQVPVMGVNLGHLGFLADFSRDEVDDVLAEIAAGRFRLVDHLMFECEVLRNGQPPRSDLGLNETSVLAGPPFSMIDICLHVDGDLATTYRSDGLIVSTPVGSTAYNLSAGGPLVRTDLAAFVFTPLNPHTLTNRTVVDSASRSYEISVPRPNDGSACVVDGRVLSPLVPGDRVRVRRAVPRFTLVETRNHGYYRTLREKLHWGGGLRGAGQRATPAETADPPQPHPPEGRP